MDHQVLSKQASILHCTVLLSKCEILDFAEFSTDLNKDLGISMNSHDESAWNLDNNR